MIFNDGEEFEHCDEEKSYDEWVSKNLPYIHDHKASIGVMKKVYMDGFASGFEYRKRLSAQEHLQK